MLASAAPDPDAGEELSDAAAKTQDWLAGIFDGAPDWAIALGVLVVAVLVALLVHAIIYAVARRVTKRTPGVADSSIVRRTRGAARWVFIFFAIRLTMPVFFYGPEGEDPILAVGFHDPIRHLLAVLLIAAITWFIIRIVSVADDVILERYQLDVEDNLAARRVHTQTRVLSRTIMIIVGIIGASAALMTFPSVRQIGASLLASAGLAGLVLGFAARPTLGNLIAGLQLALTQPIRLDDVVIVEGEWGRIEEITATYVVVRIWDERRLVVPLQFFIEQPFQNWTRTRADILGTVFIYTDYTVPVDAIRTKLREIVEVMSQWDQRVCVVQVTNATERTVEVRALVSAANSGAAWELRCAVRERLIRWLQEEYPHALPRDRAEVALERRAEHEMDRPKDVAAPEQASAVGAEQDLPTRQRGGEPQGED
jgi:small-conductance mechanosensitive channel